MTNRSKRSVRWLSRASHDWQPGRRDEYGLLVRMFVDDVRLMAVPYDRDDKGEERHRLLLTPGDDEARTQVAILVNVRERHDPLQEVEEFIRDAAWVLASEGRAVYEIVRGEVDIESVAWPVFRLELLPFGPIVRVASTYVQWLPRIRRQGRKRWATIPRDRIWELRLPRRLGSPMSQRRLVGRLASMPTLTPDFALEDLKRAAAVGYEFDAYRLQREITIARRTRRWGWPARGSWSQDATEYFLIFREILFRRSLAFLRRHIVKELNVLLRRLRIDVEIGIVEPASVESIEVVLERLRKGEWEFSRATREAGIL
jgi:hypothetical protein